MCFAFPSDLITCQNTLCAGWELILIRNRLELQITAIIGRGNDYEIYATHIFKKIYNYSNKALSLSIHKEARYGHLFQVNVSLNWLRSTGFILVYIAESDRRGKPFAFFHVVMDWLVMLPMVIFQQLEEFWKWSWPFWHAVRCAFNINSSFFSRCTQMLHVSLLGQEAELGQ